MEKAGGGQPYQEKSTPSPPAGVETLNDLGIGYKLSTTAQKISAIPEEEFEAHLSEMREEQKEITVA